MLYPGKHVEASLYILEKDDGSVHFYGPLVGRGNETINNVAAKIMVYDLDSNEIVVLNTERKSLELAERKELSIGYIISDKEGLFDVTVIDFLMEDKMFE